jgi:peptidoglycan/xylan/chitin deacetylase (PgdA/CDA1 family)
MYSPSPVTRKDRVANWLARTGLLRMAEYLPQRECLVVMNHHRIGDGAATPYDSGVFSATAEALDRQLRFLKKRFRCLTLEETIAFVEGRTRLRGAGVLLTFDDGYLDNFQAAFPCLRSHGVQAVFFLPTRFIGAEYMTWWDSVAYMVKNANRRKFSIAYPAPADFDVDAEGLDTVLLRLFRTYKAPETQDGERFLAELSEITNCGPLPRERMFLNWEEARQMLHGGMAIGSHTHGHELLAKLTPERQLEEMTRSKQLIEQNLSAPCDSIAYPYGLTSSFTAKTVELAGAAGYRIGFSFFGGVNRRGSIHPRNVHRQAVLGGPKLEQFRMRALVAGITGEVDY